MNGGSMARLEARFSTTEGLGAAPGGAGATAIGGFFEGLFGREVLCVCQRPCHLWAMGKQNPPMRTPPDPLDPLLERWRAEAPPLETRVAPEVWQRIRSAEAVEMRFGWRARLEAVFAPPSFAIAFVAACVLLGLFLAEMRVSRLQADRNEQLARSYVRLIDPLLENPPPVGPVTAPHS